MEDIDPMTLDPGVRRLVMWLRAQDFKTSDSGDGVTKIADGDEDACSCPHVHMPSVDGAAAAITARRLQRKLQDIGLAPLPGRIAATYDPADDSAIVSLYHVSDDDLPDSVA